VDTVSLTTQQLPLPEVWYAPQFDTRVGYNDFPNNFTAIIESGTTPCGWPTARSHTNVFSIYNPFFYVNNVTNAQRTAFIQYLKVHNMKLCVCINPLLKTDDPCTWREGFDTIASHNAAVSGLKAAIQSAGGGFTLDYLSLDSPLGVCIYPNGTCSLPSIDAGAQQTVNAINIYRAAFPNLKVIQLDGIASFPPADVQVWFADIQALQGKPMDGIIDDFNWYFESTNELPNAAAECAAAGVDYGLFYHGFCGTVGGNNNPVQYALGMKINMQCYNASQSPAPARVCIATWGTPLTVTAPETTYTNLSALCNLTLTSPYVLMSPPVGLYSVSSGSSYGRYTSSYSQFLSWTGSGGGYSAGGILGGVVLNPYTCGIQGLVPLYQYYNTSINQYALSLSTTDTDLNSYGYTMNTIIGYVFPTLTGSASGGVPLYAKHKYVGPVNQYAYSNTQPNPSTTGSYNSFQSQYGYWAQINNNNPIAYMLPGYFHNVPYTFAPPARPLENWRQTYFGISSNTGIAANTVDFGSDGLPNLLEYALGSNPLVENRSSLPICSATSGKLTLTFPRNVSATDVILTVQGSDSLIGGWTDLASSVRGAATTALVAGVTVTETNNGATFTVQVQDLYSITDPAHPRRFMRLVVSEP